MKKEDIIFERKEFLNLAGHNGMGNIVTNIVKSEWGNSDKYDRSVEIKLDIADCSRVITMDLDVDDAYSRENSLHKVDVLIDVLKDLKKALAKECKIHERLEAKKSKLNKD